MKPVYPYKPPSDGTDTMISLTVALVILIIVIIVVNFR